MKRRVKKKWIKKAVRRPGALSKQLNIPILENIPITLLREIVAAKAGQTIRNPTMKGKRVIRVTRLLERMAIMAINLKSIKRMEKKKSKRIKR